MNDQVRLAPHYCQDQTQRQLVGVAQSITELGPGPERTAIELETDRRAAEPYEILTVPDRLLFLADLAALPG